MTDADRQKSPDALRRGIAEQEAWRKANAATGQRSWREKMQRDGRRRGRR